MKTYILQVSKRFIVKAVNRPTAIADLKADVYDSPVTNDFTVEVIQEIEQEPTPSIGEETITEGNK